MDKKIKNLELWPHPELRYMAFDLEIAKEVPENGDRTALRPLGITCAGIYKSNGDKTNFHGTPQMTPDQCQKMADYVLGFHEAGWTLVTWNGLGFDLSVLAEECQDDDYTEAIKGLAMDHIDVAFAMFCDKGFMVGLNTAAMGMGLEGKTEGMKGDLAPVMWKQGEAEREKVLEYVVQDATVTGQVYESIVGKGRLRWTARSGRTNYWHLPLQVKGIPTVREALERPEPDTSWMTNPWEREKFVGWIQDG